MQGLRTQEHLKTQAIRDRVSMIRNGLTGGLAMRRAVDVAHPEGAKNALAIK